MRVPGFVRQVTDPLLGPLRVPVMSGVNRGRWWSLISAGSGYASGRRAGPQMTLLSSLIQPGDVMWDVGAHHGYVTLFAAGRVGAGGAVHAFEPSVSNRALLQRHVRWNGLRNAMVHPFALSDHDGESSFGGTGTSKMYALGAGPEKVLVRSAASLVAAGVCPAPTFLKIDVEGAEAGTVAGVLPVLPRTARLLIAMHDREVDARCSEMLAAAGFELVPSRALERSRAGDWVSDPDLFCIGPDHAGRERDLGLLRAAGF
jgi:FkbM family methyltransferase